MLSRVGAGSILNERWIVTAKHIIPRGNETYSNDLPTYIYTNIDNTLKLGITSSVHPLQVVKKFCLPKKNNEHWSKSDIALLKLGESIDLKNSAFRSIPMAKPETIDRMKNIVLAGWGYTKSEEERSFTRYLKSTEMIVARQNNQGKLLCTPSDGLICAQRIKGLGCIGDSGGPAMIRNNKTQSYELVGVISAVDTKCEIGNILVNLKRHISWIENIMKNEPKEFECSNIKNECTGPNPEPYC
ncbi:serine protease 55-like [Brevipalpus obovatus]|uniref:serine protease 55-like n=1 Tax=Brevipalpus obovatus TaxID=246614 RepID=UPI003D9F1244